MKSLNALCNFFFLRFREYEVNRRSNAQNPPPDCAESCLAPFETESSD